METQLKLKDLRIGNLIKDGHDIEAISVRHLQMMVEGQAEFDPIPLTEEWLLKMGFEYNGWNYDFGKFRFHAQTTRGDGIFQNTEFSIRTAKESVIVSYIVQHVHQLQNLFFALTGQELTIKQ